VLTRPDTFYAVTPHTPHTWFTRTPVVRSFNHLFQKLDSVELPGDIVFESLSYFGLYGENVTVTARTPAAAPTNRVIINASIVNPTAGGSGGSGGDGGSLTGWQIALIVIACVAATAAVAAALALLVLRRRGAAARRAAYTGVTSKCSDHSTDGALPPAAAGDRKYGVGKSADGPLAGSGYTHASSLDTAMTASTAGSGDATAAPALRAAAKPVSAATAAAGSVAVPPPSGAPEAPCGETPKREGTDSLLQRIFQSEESLRAPLSSSSSLSDADGIGGSMAPPVLASNAGGSNGAAGGGGSGSGGSAGTSAGGPPREQRAVIARQLAALTEEYGGPATPAQWQVHGQLGRGAFGVVYRGTWRGLEVAIKRVLFQVMTNAGEERDRRQALREAAINATLDHANIVPTYTYDMQPLGGPPGSGSGSGVLDWQMYIIQEYCDGGSLFDAIQEGRFQGDKSASAAMECLRTLINLAVDIACGCAYIHSKGIIHGDLKPDNVLLKSRPAAAGGSYVAKIADFGMSMNIRNNSHVSGVKHGTPLYIAPEILRTGTASRGADVYSFGVMLWELYHGMSAWQHLMTVSAGPLKKGAKPAAFYPGLFSYKEDAQLPAAAEAAGAGAAQPDLRERALAAWAALGTECLAEDPAARPTFDLAHARLLAIRDMLMDTDPAVVQAAAAVAAAAAAPQQAPLAAPELDAAQAAADARVLGGKAVSPEALPS